MPEREVYLGDGVYARFDGYMIILDLRAQGPDTIALEPPVLDALLKFAITNGVVPTFKGTPVVDIKTLGGEL